MNTLKRILPYLKPYKRIIAATLFAGLILSGIALATAKFVQFIFDDIFVAKDQHMLVIAPLLIIALYIVSGFVRFFHMYWLRYIGEKVAFDIRNDMQGHFANLSLNFHNANATGALISKTTNDVLQIQTGFSLMADCVKEPITAIGLIGYLFYTNYKLTLISIVAAPILVLTSRSLGRSVHKYSLVQQQMFEKFTHVLKETLDGIRIIKAFSLERHMMKRFQETIDEILAVRRRILAREEVAGPIFELLAAVTFAGVLFYTGRQIIHGETTTGAFMSFVYAMMSLQNPIKKLQEVHVKFQHTVAATERIFEVLDTPLQVRDPEADGGVSVPWPDDWKEICFENVQFAYGEKPILQDISLNVKRGEVVALVGPSGSGKTTMVNLLPRFFDVREGRITVDGIDLRRFKVNDLRRHVALVSQDVFLFNESIRENIIGGQTADLSSSERVKKSVEAAHASRFVRHFPLQLDTVVGERGSFLSGGERQRISIARALYKDAPILILDEATSALDSESEKVVQEALEELMKGRTTFVIAHRLSTVQKADRIVVLSQGRVAEVGSHQELLAQKGLYHHLHQLQFLSA